MTFSKHPHNYALKLTEEQLNDVLFMIESRMKSTFFTRAAHCKMDFKSFILFELNFVRKSLALELDEFFETIKGTESSLSKQGYSEARQKISPNAFIKMADTIQSWFYGDDDFKTFHGYRLSAIDARGSFLRSLPRGRTLTQWGTILTI